MTTDSNPDSFHLTSACGREGHGADPFDAWHDEIENFATRGERLRDLGWTEALRAAWIAGRNALVSELEAADAADAQQDGGDLSPEQEAFCTRNCCWSGHHRNCPRYDPPEP